ncbi:MAG: phosphotransferase [Gammaproteobacteria bacterium]|nr:phosphotransferase [Gammaproteobacteria bacterium]
MDQRLNQIQHWLENELQCTITSIEPASADASFRRYFRVFFSNSEMTEIEIDKSYIIMDAPPPQEDIEPFIRSTEIFKSCHIHVPDIYAQDITNGFLILEDFGSSPYLSILNDKNVDSLYSDAFDSLLKLTKTEDVLLPEYDQQKLQTEMDLYLDWYIQVHLNIKLTSEEKQILTSAQKKIIEIIQEQPKVIVHRDFHSRNLMFVEHLNPGVIDFQDAVIGPCTYDLVSLLKDSYIKWSEEKINQWLNTYQRRLFELNIISNMKHEQFKKWFDVMGMQRQIKVVGIFSRLYHRDGKDNYLNDIPLTYQNLLNASKQYSEFSDLYQLLQKYSPL